MTQSDFAAFEHAQGFVQSELHLGIQLGPLETAYQELFADVLADGIITSEERAQLQTAAERMGLDRERLEHLERAMLAAYEMHHRVRVVEHHERQSIAPAAEAADDDRVALLLRVRELESRVRELEDEVQRLEANISVEIDVGLTEVDEATSEHDIEGAWRRVRRDPTNPDALIALGEALDAAGERDRRLFVAQALTVLNAAGIHDEKWVNDYKDTALPKPRAGLSQSAWTDQLLHPDQEITTGNIFGIIAPAVLLGKVAALGREGHLYKPGADQKQDPALSTVSAVRALAWAAAVLGVGIPTVVVDPKCDGQFVHTPALPPMTLVASGALSGRAQQELAFLAGRHLTMYRAEHYVRALFPSVPDLEDLFLAALTLGNPALPLAADVKQRAVPIASALEPLLQPTQIDALRAHLLRFVEEGGRTNLQRWGAAVDKTACRAGLLLCGDLTTAAELLKAEEGPSGELLRDLIAFATSAAHAKLRQQLGISLAN